MQWKQRTYIAEEGKLGHGRANLVNVQNPCLGKVPDDYSTIKRRRNQLGVERVDCETGNCLGMALEGPSVRTRLQVEHVTSARCVANDGKVAT